LPLIYDLILSYANISGLGFGRGSLIVSFYDTGNFKLSPENIVIYYFAEDCIFPALSVELFNDVLGD